MRQDTALNLSFQSQLSVNKRFRTGYGSNMSFQSHCPTWPSKNDRIRLKQELSKSTVKHELSSQLSEMRVRPTGYDSSTELSKSLSGKASN